ncbi:MAG TPA: pseudouridine synthase [Planctomycetaceae bacterium]|nr:pseudouridine synthase [Planctomycetaceae bacterium]
MSAHPDDRRSSSENAPAQAGMRLQRFLAATGLGSRRKCEEFIVAGRVSVDSQVVRDLGTRVDPQSQEVRVDGELVHRDPLRYFLLNKPRSYLCTSSDPAGRPRAIDLVPAGKLRLFTVGRLDESSEGLVLVTNDGELAHRLAHPRFQVPRTYALQVAGRPTAETFAALKEGLYFQEGRFRVRWVRRVGTRGNSTFLEVGLTHGHNREIRRLFARLGHKVMRLRRVAFGPLALGRLAEGRFRPLTATELSALRELASNRRRGRREKMPKKSASGLKHEEHFAAGPQRRRQDRAEVAPRFRTERERGRFRRSTTRDGHRSERSGSLQGAKRRARHRPGISQKARSSNEQGSRGQRKRRHRNA